MEYNLQEIAKKFKLELNYEPYGNGHINDTYIINNAPRYILQRINSDVFTKPEEVMENIEAVTDHLRKKIAAAGGDVCRETLTLIQTDDGRSFYKADENNYFRVYRFIENAVSYDRVENPVQFYNAAKAFGKFQNMLSDFPADRLHETIKKFHDTRSRFEAFRQSVKADICGRAKYVVPEIEFVLSRESDCGVIVNATADGSVPIRVTHNDTKLNNVMLDSRTGEGVCVIDLDTVMPGSLLYDFGDAVRFGASSGDEDETDLSKIYMSEELFEQFSRGFLEETASVMTDMEKELLPFSAKLVTLECGMRFLTDYLSGDTYFKIHRKNHNLDRARTQFKLVKDMEDKADTMRKIVDKYC